jgi:hypothetical protein
MYRLIIFLVLAALVFYYFMCFAQVFGLLKFTNKKIQPKKLLIPFYYLYHD